jgi:predicted SAM-dependent methyltransferase
MRLNFGCGAFPLQDWINYDQDPSSKADRIATVPPINLDDELADEVYAGHFLEHLARADADKFLRECYRVLKPGGRCGILVPDTREIMRRYIAREEGVGWHQDEHGRDRRYDVTNLDDVCAYWLFSTVQPSHHVWAYDLDTLAGAMQGAGFQIVGEIDRFKDVRLSTGQWYQCGLDGLKPV